MLRSRPFFPSLVNASLSSASPLLLYATIWATPLPVSLTGPDHGTALKETGKGWVISMARSHVGIYHNSTVINVSSVQNRSRPRQCAWNKSSLRNQAEKEMTLNPMVHNAVFVG